MTPNSPSTDLFTPMDLGALSLANRIVMAPLTRSRMGQKAYLTKCMLATTHNVPALV